MNDFLDEKAELNGSFFIEEWKIVPTQNEIILYDEIIQVENKVMQVLVYLASRADQVVSREELMQAVWPENYVSEEVLTRCISILRKIFKDDTHAPRIIKTIRKKGYKLIAKITIATDDEPGKLPSAKKTYSLAYFVILIPVLFLIGFGLYTNEDKSDLMEWHDVPIATSKGNETYPAISPDGSRVAYALRSSQSTGLDIWVSISGVEGSEIQITNDHGNESAPTWSPDGRFIAFIKDKSMYTIPSLGGTAQKLGDLNEGITERMSWSPDGKKLAYVDRLSSKDSYSIYLMDVETGMESKLTNPTNQHWGDYSPSFSPDGNQISFIRGISAGTHDIFVYDLNSKEERRITYDTRRTIGQTWAPDGTIIYSVPKGRTGYLWSIRPEGGEPVWLNIVGKYPSIDRAGSHLVVEDWNHDYDIARIHLEDKTMNAINIPDINSTQEDFSPQLNNSGDEIAFVSNKSGSFELYIYSLITKQTKRITHLESEYLSSPQWSGDDSKLAFNVFTSKGNADVYSIDLQSEEVEIVLSSRYNEVSPQWSYDNKGFYFSSNQTGKWQVWYYDLERDAQEQITNNGGYSTKLIDGEYLYFTKFDSTGIWKKSLKNDREERLIDDLHLYDWSNFAVTDSGIHYVSRQLSSASPVLKYYEFQSGKTSIITSLNNIPPIAGMTLSSDGAEVIITRQVRSNSDVILYEGKNIRKR